MFKKAAMKKKPVDDESMAEDKMPNDESEAPAKAAKADKPPMIAIALHFSQQKRTGLRK